MFCKKRKLGFHLLWAGCLLCSLMGCASHKEFPNRPITLVCPWSVGGGTDRVSRQMAFFLEHELGVPVNVINATGGRGVTGHSRGLRARPDGYTLAMMTVELNMLHHQDLTSITWQDAEALMSINEDAAAIFVQSDAPWQNAGELLEYVRQHPQELTASGTAVGGIWHLALAGWLQAGGLEPDAVKWIPMNGAAPSLQELAGGGIDIVCCSLPEARTLFEAGNVRCLGVMAEEQVPGYTQVPTLKLQGQDWVMVGWRGLAVPAGTPQERVDRLLAAIERIVKGEAQVAGKTFPDFMAGEGFNNKWRKPDEFRKFLAVNDEKFGKLLRSEAFANISTGKIGPMMYPGLLFALLAVLFAALGWRRMLIRRGKIADRTSLEHETVDLTLRVREHHPEGDDYGEKPSLLFAVTENRTGLLNLVFMLAAVVVYPLFAESVGFVLLAGAMLFVLLLRLGTRWITGIAVSVLFVPLVYHVFAHFLRVPLPRGFLGW